MNDKWKQWKQNLLIDVLTTAILAVLMLLICVSAKATLWATIDNIVLTCLVSTMSGTIWDMVNRVFKLPKTLTRQYWVHFVIVLIAIGSFTVGYMGTSWFISILFLSISVIFTTFNWVSVKYAWLPSILSASDQYLATWNDIQKLLVGKTEDEIKEVLKNQMRFFPKNDTLSDEPDLTLAVFRDSEDNAISYTTASNSGNFSEEELSQALEKIELLSLTSVTE